MECRHRCGALARFSKASIVLAAAVVVSGDPPLPGSTPPPVSAAAAAAAKGDVSLPPMVAYWAGCKDRVLPVPACAGLHC